MATRKTRSKRLALDAKGEDTNDLTQAVTGVYQYLEPDPADAEKQIVVDEVRYEPETDDPTTRALAIFGFHTHCGNWINKAVNTDGLEGDDVKERLDEYRQMLAEGGWTNRKGEAEAGAAIFIKAFARLQGVDEDRIKTAWNESWDDEAKEAVKGDPKIKAIVAEIRAERAAERASKAEGESKLSSLAY